MWKRIAGAVLALVFLAFAVWLTRDAKPCTAHDRGAIEAWLAGCKAD